ncbi:MAG: tyrosine--tRNA ligase [Candidatus Kapaibacteriales bacterium]
MSKFPPLKEQMDLIEKHSVDLLPSDELEMKISRSIKTNKPLRIKFGADPSRPDLHIGHAVVLSKLRQFQDLGHKVILIIGDFTAMIGDPTGKSKTRPQLTLEQTKENGQSYIDQATIVLSKENLEVRHNSVWLSGMGFSEVINLAAKYTVAQLLEREDFSNRYKNGIPISVHELLYPLAQAYDSYAIESDVELGGTDQKFNLLVGREVQKSYGMEPQCILTLPILEGTDGVEKMSKSLGNYIGLTDTERDIFGKTMSIPDALIPRYMKYTIWADSDEVQKVDKGLSDGTVHPREAKVNLAMKLVDRYYGEGKGQAALEEFERIFKQGDVPDDVEEVNISSTEGKAGILDILLETKFAPSKKEAKRLIDQGAVSIDGEKVSSLNEEIQVVDKRLLKVGKKRFAFVYG